MAYEKGSGTGGTTKKKPDDPYFDSDSPAGSNFKRSSGSTSKSSGFQNSQLDDPYFSNTSPAGSTMSSDKSTWRNTNSGWNVPPSGGTAAQGGGSTATRRSPSDDPYYDDRSPAGSTFESQRDRRSSGSTVRRDEAGGGGSSGFGNAAPERERYTGAIPTRDLGDEFSSTVYRNDDTNRTVWSPGWNTESQFSNISFSGPFSQQLGELAERAIGATSKVFENLSGTGYGDMIQDRQQRALDEQNSVVGPIGAALVGLFGADEAIQKGTFLNYVPSAENSRAVEDANGDVILIGPNFARPTGVSAAEWEQQFGRDENGDLNTRPSGVFAVGQEQQFVDTKTTLSIGEAASALGGAFNATYNMANPNNQFIANKVEMGDDAPSMWETFVTDLQQRISGYDANNVYYNNLPADQKRVAAQAYNDLQIHGPDAQLAGMEALLTWDAQIESLRNQSLAAAATGDAVSAAQLEAQANDMAKMTPTDVVESNYNWAAEMLAAVATPSPIDLVGIPVGAARIWGSKVLNDMGQAMLKDASKGATQAASEAAEITVKYQEALRLADDWVQQSAGDGSELYKLWTGNRGGVVETLLKPTPETEISRIKFSFDDSIGPVLAHAQSQVEAKLLVSAFLDGTAYIDNPKLGRNPFVDPELIRDMGMIARHKEKILALESLNDGAFDIGRIQGEISDFVQRQLVKDFGLWPADVPFGVRKVVVEPYVTKDGKSTSKFAINMIDSNGETHPMFFRGDVEKFKLFDTKEAADSMAKGINDKIGAVRPNAFTTFTNLTRTFLATTFLYTPQFIIGNALAASGAFLGDGVKSLRRSQKLLNKYQKLYGGAAPTGEILDVMKATGMVGGEAGELTGAGTAGVRTIWGAAKDKLPKQLKWMVTLQDEVAKKMGNMAFGTGIGAEEFWRLNYFNHAFDEIHTYGRDEATSIFAAGLQALGVDATLASALTDTFYRFSAEESAQTVLKKMRELTGASEVRAGLAALNIGPTTVSAAGQRRMADLINSNDPADKEKLGAAIGSWLRDEFADIDDMMLGSELPPVPWRQVFTNMTATQQGSEILTNAINFGKRAGLSEDEARKAGTALAKMVYESEMGEFELIRKAMGIDPTNDQLQLAVVFYNKTVQEKRRIEQAVDSLHAQLGRVETQAEARAIYDEVNKLWSDYSGNVKVWGNDMRTGSLVANAPSQQMPFGVGEIVRLNDGTEVTIKQVLTENDVTSYVVTPRIGRVGDDSVTTESQAYRNGTRVRLKDGREGQIVQITAFSETGAIAFVVEPDGGYSSVKTGISTQGKSAEQLRDEYEKFFVALAKREEVESAPKKSPSGTRRVASGPAIVGYDEIEYAIVPQAAQAAPAPTFVERTINASEIAPRTADVQADFAASMQRKQVADLYDTILDEYMGMGSVDEDIQRVWAAGSVGQRSAEEWKMVKEASRNYISSARNNMLLTYGQYPSAEFFDEMLNAEMQINAASDHVIAMLERKRVQAFNEEISWGDFYKYRDETWKQWNEFSYSQYQYATIAGARHTLGKGGDDILGQVPIQAIEPLHIDVNDVRRAQAIQENKIADGVRIPDKRTVASINKHLGFGIKKLDDMTEAQMREAWRYYRKSAADQGVNFEAQWFRYRTGEFGMFSGIAEDADFIETMWRLEAQAYQNGNAEVPNFGTARRQRVADAVHMAKMVYDNIDSIAKTSVPGINPATRGEVLKLINQAVGSLNDVRYRAAKAGQEAASYGMLNYWKRKGFDKKLGYLFGFHYYQTRAPLNWARRIAQNPAIAYDLYQYNRALTGENQQQFDQGAPRRIEGTLPNPMKSLATNIGKMGDTPLNDIATAVGEWMPERFYEPSKFVIPYGWPNDFIDPSVANNGFERNMLRALKMTPVLLPQYAIPMSMALDFMYPRENAYSRMADVQAGDYSRSLRMGAYALQSVPKQPESSWASALNPILGNMAPGIAGDPFDTGRVNRAIMTGIAAGDYDPDIGRLAIAQMDNAQLGLENIPEMNDPKMQAKIQEVVNSAINDAGMERFANLMMGYFLRMPGQDTSDIEKELRLYAQERASLGYGYDNEQGSKLAVDEFTNSIKLSSGVPLDDALPAMWNYSSTYDPSVDDKYGRIDVQVINDMAREERDAIYDKMDEAENQFVWENPTAGSDDLYNLRDPFYAEIEKLKEKYPSATIWENDGRYANRSPHQNSNERALAEIRAVYRYEPPGKPEWPGEGASPAQIDQYYTDYGEWSIKRLNVIDRIGAQWILGEDTPMSGEGGVNSETARYRATIGRYAQDIVDTETLRYKSGVYIEWYMRNQLAKETRQPYYAAEREALVGEFGEDGFALWQKWKAIPEDPKLEFPNWTEAHQEFIRENPEVQAMKIYDASPEIYEQLMRRGGGPRIFEAIAEYPPKGPERDRWYKTQPRSVIDATHWWFGVNDDLRSTRSRGWEEGQAIGENWLNYTGPRPVGSDRQPIGINPNDQGITYSYPFRPAQDSSEYGDYLPMVRYPQQTYNPVNSREEYLGRVNEQPAPMIGPRENTWAAVLPDFSPDFQGIKGYTAPPATTPQELVQYQQAVQDGTLTEWIAKREAAIDAGERTTTARSSGGGGGGGYRGYWYRGRYYSRRRGYRRRGGRRRGGYRRYSRGGGGGRRYGGYGGGGGGSTVDEGQELFLNTNNPPRIYAREFASWLMPSSSSRDVWRPTGASTGMRQPQQPSIRPWRRINVRA